MPYPMQKNAITGTVETKKGIKAKGLVEPIANIEKTLKSIYNNLDKVRACENEQKASEAISQAHEDIISSYDALKKRGVISIISEFLMMIKNASKFKSVAKIAASTMNEIGVLRMKDDLIGFQRNEKNEMAAAGKITRLLTMKLETMMESESEQEALARLEAIAETVAANFSLLAKYECIPTLIKALRDLEAKTRFDSVMEAARNERTEISMGLMDYDSSEKGSGGMYKTSEERDANRQAANVDKATRIAKTSKNEQEAMAALLSIPDGFYDDNIVEIALRSPFKKVVFAAIGMVSMESLLEQMLHEFEKRPGCKAEVRLINHKLEDIKHSE